MLHPLNAQKRLHDQAPNCIIIDKTKGSKSNNYSMPGMGKEEKLGEEIYCMIHDEIVLSMIRIVDLIT